MTRSRWVAEPKPTIGGILMNADDRCLPIAIVAALTGPMVAVSLGIRLHGGRPVSSLQGRMGRKRDDQSVQFLVVGEASPPDGYRERTRWRHGHRLRSEGGEVITAVDSLTVPSVVFRGGVIGHQALWPVAEQGG